MPEQQMYNSLKDLSDETFIQRSYLALLGRPADPTGYRNNLARLQAGTSREQIWQDLAGSEEGRKFLEGQGAPSRPVAVAPSTRPAARPAM